MFNLDLDYSFSGDIDEDHGAKAQLVIREWMNDVSEEIEQIFKRHVPVESGRTKGAIRKGSVRKTVEGFEADIGVTPIFGLKYGENPEYPKFVNEGTGNFGPNKNSYSPTGGRPRKAEFGGGLSTGNVMVFQGTNAWAGSTVFATHVKGQQGQGWLDDVFREANKYVTLKKRELAAILAKL